MLRHDQNSVVFHFAAPSFDSEEANTFRYVLQGFDRGWSQWSPATTKEYTNLSGGRYVFRVMARNVYGDHSREAAYRFTVLAPWHRTRLAYGAYALLLAALFYGGIVLNSRHLRRANIRLERLIQQRTLELEERNLELRTLNEQKDEFLGIAAHDLRSPLASASSYTDLLLHFLSVGRHDPGLCQRFLGNIRTTTEQMRALVDDLLEVAAIETGRLELRIARFRLSEVLAEVDNLHGPAAEAKGIELVVDGDTAEIAVTADRARVVEVLDNLVTNAIKFTHPGGGVRVSCELAGSEVVVHVEDTGQGLEESELGKVFSGKKLSARPTGGEASTGLGLVIVKKILELHGSTLQVRSQKGTGSTFSFSLPLAE